MFKKFVFAIFATCLMFACSRPEGAASLRDVISKPVSTTVVTSGLFLADSLLSFNREMLVRTFGEENIVEKKSESPLDGNNYYVVVLFPESPKQIEIVLQDSTQLAAVKAVIIGSKSNWTTRSGVVPDMTLQELQALNGRPFLFYGGGWDQGGYITNWKDGLLQGKISCRLDRNHIMPYDMSKGDYDTHEFSSDSRDAQNGNPAVEEITLSNF
jgi:hypothetical protein